MKQNSIRTKHLKRSAPVSLETALKDAKVPSSPEMRVYCSEVDEQQLVSLLIRNVKKEHKWTSPLVSWMGHLFPDEYKEMVKADAR